MRALLSIKPAFADRIFEGTKRFEFRRNIFKQPINTVIVYASAPTSMVIGEFDVETVIFDELDILWDTTKHYAGISRQYFYTYFEGKNKGYAISIAKARRYNNPLNLQQEYGVQPPQSFLYLLDPKSA
jgi:predicted transcriptional regulator